jgi:2-keto-4-pentenoate hydratase
MIGAERKNILMDAADLLLDTRRSAVPIADLPPELQPASLDEAYFVQDTMAVAFGEVGGWKVGAPSLEATPIFAPMPRAWIGVSAASVEGIRFRGLEAEIAFLLGSDLPPRPTPYTREEIAAAIASAHPAIEILESAFIDPDKASPFAKIADLQMHGGFIYGPAFPDWQSVDFHQEQVSLAVDGIVRVERTGSNTSGDLLRLLPWLASEAAARTGGLHAGHWITTGSWTGITLAGPASDVDVKFSTAGRVTVRFA